MAQHILIKSEVASSAPSSVGKNKPVPTDSKEIQPFSSELNKQIDKHANTQEKSHAQVEPSTKTHTDKQQDKELKAEKKDGDNGKNLPKEVNSDPEQIDAEDISEVIVNTEIAVSTEVVVSSDDIADVDIDVDNLIPTAVKNSSAEIVNTVAITTTAENQELKPKVAVEKTIAPEIKDTKKAAVKPLNGAVAVAKVSDVELPEASKNSSVKQVILDAQSKDSKLNPIVKEAVTLSNEKQAVKEPVEDAVKKAANSQQAVVLKPQQSAVALKLSNAQLQQQEITMPTKVVSQNVVEGLSSDQKKQATGLRPDILYGINKKYSAESDKTVSSKLDFPIATEKVKTSERVATKALSEGRLMADIVSQVKPGLQHTSPTVERGGLALGSLVSTYTPAGSVSQGQATAATTPVLDIQPALQTSAWNRVMSGRVVWMAREGVQQAELKLNPANLGPVEVRLNINNDQATVTFIASNATTRDALEQALPKLRESFMENGMELTDAEVTQHSFEQQHQDDAAEAESTAEQNGQASVEKEELGSDEQQNVNEQTELGSGLSLYA